MQIQSHHTVDLQQTFTMTSTHLSVAESLESKLFQLSASCAITGSLPTSVLICVMWNVMNTRRFLHIHFHCPLIFQQKQMLGFSKFSVDVPIIWEVYLVGCVTLLFFQGWPCHQRANVVVGMSTQRIWEMWDLIIPCTAIQITGWPWVIHGLLA